ncbi:MAG TPA: hypothetical protein VFJ87_02500 [Rhodanobacteraceae bacterium]|jgi:hypothetical protein|nr:hypothetical protein [Rhodanobacteraceae bacterium]
MSNIKQAAAQMSLADEAGAMLRDNMAPREAVQALLDAGKEQDALKLLARLLPKRYVVAWVCQCARDQNLPVEAKAGASLAEKWVRDPSEDNRRAAFEFANAGGFETLGAVIAATAGMAGGSLAPAKQETPVPPPEHMTAMVAAGAVTMLAALDEAKFAARRTAFIQRAFELLGTPPAHGGAARTA